MLLKLAKPCIQEVWDSIAHNICFNQMNDLKLQAYVHYVSLCELLSNSEHVLWVLSFSGDWEAWNTGFQVTFVAELKRVIDPAIRGCVFTSPRSAALLSWSSVVTYHLCDFHLGCDSFFSNAKCRVKILTFIWGMLLKQLLSKYKARIL